MVDAFSQMTLSPAPGVAAGRGAAGPNATGAAKPRVRLVDLPAAAAARIVAHLNLAQRAALLSTYKASADLLEAGGLREGTQKLNAFVVGDWSNNTPLEQGRRARLIHALNVGTAARQVPAMSPDALLSAAESLTALAKNEHGHFLEGAPELARNAVQTLADACQTYRVPIGSILECWRFDAPRENILTWLRPPVPRVPRRR